MSLRIISKHINPKLLGIPGFELIQGVEMGGRDFGKKELRSGSWAALYGVARSWTRLKWLSSSSSYSQAIATAPLLKPRVPGEGRRGDRRQTRKIEQAECQVKSSFNLQERRKGQKTEVMNGDLLGRWGRQQHTGLAGEETECLQSRSKWLLTTGKSVEHSPVICMFLDDHKEMPGNWIQQGIWKCTEYWGAINM